MITIDFELIINPRENNWDFNPGNIYQEILQNVKAIVTTLKGSVPLDRAFGILPNVIDEPINIARAKLSAEIVKAVKEFEPRARIKNINFSGDMSNAEIIIKMQIILS